MRAKYDNNGRPWLRIKNWEKYQPSRKLFKKDARLKYVLDYTDKLDNYDFQKLTHFQRSLYESLCLMCGVRPLRTVPNDPVWIASASHTLREERHCVPQALAKLIALGFLIPIETEKFSEDRAEKGIGDRDREGDREGEGDGEPLASKQVSYEDGAEDKDVPELGAEVLDEDVPVHKLPCFDLLHTAFGVETRLPDTIIRSVHTALRGLGKDPAWMQGCAQFALNHKKFWANVVFSPKTFANALISGLDDPDRTKLPAQYDLHRAKGKSAGA